MLSSILFQDLGEKAGHEGYTQTPDDLNDYLLEEEKLVGGEVEEDSFEVSYVMCIEVCYNIATILHELMLCLTLST